MAEPVTYTVDQFRTAAKRAYEAGDIASAKKLIARGMAAEQQAPKATGFFDSLGNAFRGTVDPMLEGLGATAEVMGAPEAGQALKDATSLPEGYVSPTGEFLSPKTEDEGLFGFGWKFAPGAIGEQVGQFAGQVAARGAGLSLGTAVGGPIAGAAGAIAAPAIFSAAQQIGNVANERAQNNNRDKPNDEDITYALGTSLATGLLDSLAPGAKGVITRILVEGGTEAAQSVAEQVGSTVDTEKGTSVDLHQALGEGILGAGSAGTFDATTAVAGAGAKAAGKAAGKAAESIRYDSKPYTEDDAAAVNLLLEHAGGDIDVLENVSDTGDGTAKGVANAALRELRAKINVTASDLSALAKQSGNTEAEMAVANIVKASGHQGTPITDKSIANFLTLYNNHPDAQRLVSWARQENKIQEFTRDSARDIGGITQYTRRGDITDKRNGNTIGFMLGAGVVGGFSGFGVSTLGTLAAATAVNRIARAIDKGTNHRSRVKRYVRSVQRSGVQPKPVTGETAAQTLTRIQQAIQQAKIDQANADKAAKHADALAKKQQADAEKAAKQADILAKKQQADLERTAKQAERDARAEALFQKRNKLLDQKLAAQEAKVQQDATIAKLNETATRQMFATDTVPEGVTYFEPYRIWQGVTGAGPATTHATLLKLEGSGKVPKGTADRFKNNIRSFDTNNDEVYSIQEIVRQELNPDHKTDIPKEPKVNPQEVLQKFTLSQAKAKNRFEYKRLQGQTAGVELDLALKAAAPSLTPDQYDMLLDLRNSIDSPNMTRIMRMQLVSELLPIVFKGNGRNAKIAYWRKKFAPLAAAGNDYSISRKDESENEVEDAEVLPADENGSKLKEATEPKKDKPKDNPEGGVTPSPEPDPRPGPSDGEAPTASEQLTEADIPQPPKAVSDAVVADKPKPDLRSTLDKVQGKKTKGSLKDRFANRLASYEYAEELADAGQSVLIEYMEGLGKDTSGRVETIILENASPALTVNMVIEAFAASVGAKPPAVATTVLSALDALVSQGKYKTVRRFGNNQLKYDGKLVAGEDGKVLTVLNIEPASQDTSDLMAISQAVGYMHRMVNQDGPDVRFGPHNIIDGPHKAIKDVAPENTDESFEPLLSFIQDMRESKHGVSDPILTQIEEALLKADGKNVGTILEEMNPKEKDGRGDQPLKAVSQLLYQLGRKGERGPSVLRQEWFAGDNGRVYSKNGLAHTQAGDLMKGLIKAPSKSQVGGEEGLQFVFHGIGNLLGYDKKAIAVRRRALFNEVGHSVVADELYRLAENPFGRTMLKNSKGETTDLGTIVKDGEGFFQVLSAAHEVKSMVDFAKARNKKLVSKTPSEVLQDHEALSDLASNYETDFIVQLDASNNAYQIAGMIMGYDEVLKATGLLPREGFEGNFDEIEGADIYVDPAREIVSRIPELSMMRDEGLLPNPALRKLFKRAIGTYLYAAAYNSRKASFEDELDSIRGDAPLFKIGDNGGLISVSDETAAKLGSEEGIQEFRQGYDQYGNPKPEARVTISVKQVGEKFHVFRNGKKSAKAFKSFDEAAQDYFRSNLTLRMNSELIRDINTRYPQMRLYMSFAKAVSTIALDRSKAEPGREPLVAVPAPDGVSLVYDFKDTPEFTGHSYATSDGKVVSLGIRTGAAKTGGSGMAAYMAHMLDAWVLRAVYADLQSQHDLKTFNPIHDSFGFHPSDAARGRESWIKHMQAIGSGDYNLFLQIMQANNISVDDLRSVLKKDAQDVIDMILGRTGVAPVDASRIPTALS